MTEYRLVCECGKKYWVPSTDAGRTKPCSCGKTIEIPSLRELRRLSEEPPPQLRNERAPQRNDPQSWIGAGIVVVGIFVSAVIRNLIAVHGHFTLEDSLVVWMLQAATGVIGCSMFAKSKGLPAWLGGLLGLLGCIGLIILFFMPVPERIDPPKK